jgi:glycosyltransferase involved in cell wall biosynthesis
MKVCHLPSAHWYPRYLVAALASRGISCVQNPVPWGLYLPEHIDYLLAEGITIFHIHWPEAVFQERIHGIRQRIVKKLYLKSNGLDHDWGKQILDTASALQKIKKAGGKIVWTAHNLRPHSGTNRYPLAYDLLYRIYAQEADGVIHHSKWGKQYLQQSLLFGHACRHFIIPHGVFPDEAPLTLSKADARGRIGVNPTDFMLLTVGRREVRKGFDDICAAVSKLPLSDVIFVSVGEGSVHAPSSETREFEQRTLFVGKLTQKDLSVYARAADFLIFSPAEQQLTTGGPHVSESFGLPQITVENDYVSEVLGPNAIYSRRGVGNLIDAILEAYRILLDDRDQYDQMCARLRHRGQSKAWYHVAEQTERVYRALGESEAGSK